MEARPAHVARLQELQSQGRLLLAGPFPAVDAVDPGVAGFAGSLIVAEFTSLPAAQDLSLIHIFDFVELFAQPVEP